MNAHPAPAQTCPQGADWARWLDREAREPSAVAEDAMGTHLGACRTCQTLVEQLTTTDEVLAWRRLLLPEAPVDHTLAAVPWEERSSPSFTNDDTSVSSGAVNGHAAATAQLHGYRILRPLGQGGTGQVYLAMDPALGRSVALKMLRPDFAIEPQWAARFSREARIIASLRHEHILQVHRVESTDNGPLLVLEYVNGDSLETILAERGTLSAADAARWCREIALALAHAHRLGVLHRDVKPGNILIEAKTGKALLADFGIASRIAGQPQANTEALTRTGAMLGTPAFISPEQIAGADALDGRSDLYGLGAVLYACLTGVPPFHGTLAAVLRQAVEAEPKSPRQLNPDVPLDLETICLKCLAKEPRQRYTSADELAADLERFQTGIPILARPLNRRERTQRWVRRNPLASRLIAALVATALVSLGVAWLAWDWAAHSREQTARAEQFQRTAETNEQAAIRERDERTRLLQEQYLATVGDLIAKQRYQDARENLASIPEALHGWEYRWLQQQARQRNDRARLIGRHEDGTIVTWLAAPNASLFVTSGLDGRVLLWDGVREQPVVLENGVWSESLRAWRRFGVPMLLESGSEPQPDCFAALAWLEPGLELVGVSLRGRVRRWSLKTLKAQDLLSKPHDRAWFSLAVTEDGRSLLCGDEAGGVYRLSLEQQSASSAATATVPVQVLAPLGAGITKLARLASDHWLVGQADGTLKLLPPTLETPLQSLTLPSPIWDVAVTRDGRHLAVASGSSRIALYTFDPTARLLARTETLDREAESTSRRIVQAVQFTADGRGLLAGDDQGEVVLWRLPEGQVQQVWRAVWRPQMDPQRLSNLPWPLRRHLASVELSPDGTKAFAAGLDGVLREWQALRPSSEARCQLGPHPRLAAVPGVAGLYWLGTADGKLKLQTLSQAAPLHEQQAHEGAIVSLDVAAVADWCVTAGDDRTLRVWRRTSAGIEPLGPPYTHPQALKHVAISPDGTHVAWTDADDRVFLMHRESRQLLGQNRLHDDGGQHQGSGRLAFSCDGRFVAVAGAFQRFWLLAATDLSLVERPDSAVGVGRGVVAFALNPTQPRDLVAVDSLGQARFFPKPCHLETPRVAVRMAVAAAFTPMGERVALVDEAGTISFIDRRGCGLLPWQLPTPAASGPPTGIGFDSSGAELWLSYATGEVIVRKVAAAPPPVPVSPWSARILVQGPPLASQGPLVRAAKLDADGHVYLAAALGSTKLAGFIFARETPRGVHQEHLEEFVRPDGGRQRLPAVEWRCLSLDLADTVPEVLLRLPAADASRNSGPELWRLKRRPEASVPLWEGRSLLEPAPEAPIKTIRINAGYDLVPLRHAVRNRSLLHFSHCGHYLLQTRVNADQATGSTRLLGRQGDGMFLQAQDGPEASDDNRHRLHVAWHLDWPTYLACDAATGATLDRALVSDDVTATHLRLGLNGDAVPHFLYQTATDTDQREVWLAHRQRSAWRRERILADLSDGWDVSNLCCGTSEDAMFVLSHPRPPRMQVVRRRGGGSWSVEAIDLSSLKIESGANLHTALLEDGRRQPVIVFAASTPTGGTVWTLRPPQR